MNHRLVQSVRSGIDEAERPVQPLDSNAKAVAWAAFATLMIVLGLWVARDFLVALTWAGLIAITAWPIYTRFATRVAGSRSAALAPLLFTLLTGLVLLLPVALAMHQIAQGSEALARSLNQLREDGIPVPAWLVQLPIAGEYLDRWWRSNLGNPDVFAELRGANIESVTAWVGALGGALLHRLLLFLIALIALFLLLRDGARLADHTLVTAGRLLGHPGEQLVRKIVNATRATVNGTLATSILKGVVVGIGYVLAGVPHPLLFTVLTIALAMVPLGAWVVLFAAALTLPLQGGSSLAAAGLSCFGAAVLLIGDNLILPALIGGAAELPFLLVLIGIIGGIESFGLIGLFIGPVIMAVLLTMWREWTGAED